METTLHPFHRHHLFACQPLVTIKIPSIRKHGAGSDFDMRYLKFPPIKPAHRLHSSRFLCVNNKIAPSIMSDQGNIGSGSETETETDKSVVREKEKTEERRPIPEPPEKPLPGDCCGSGCVRCVWDVYYEELEEYNNLLKSLAASDSLKPSV